MLIIADSSPIISLAIIERFDLLEKLFDDFFITEEVFNELTKDGKPYSNVINNFFKNHVKKVKNKIAIEMLSTEIDIGEASSIVLAIEENILTILIDDLKGRKVAEFHNLKIIGTIGLLLEAKEKSLIPDIKNYLEKLLNNNIRIGERLYKKALEIAKE